MIPGFHSFQYILSFPAIYALREKSVCLWSALLFSRFFFDHLTGFYIIVDEILFFQNFYVSNQSIQLEDYRAFLFPQNKLSYSK